jgi:coenzyme F420-dependent glucose-6-phosphate dehydrogenase
VKHNVTVGVPHETLGELVVACILTEEGNSVTEDSVRDFLKERLASYRQELDHTRRVREIDGAPLTRRTEDTLRRAQHRIEVGRCLVQTILDAVARHERIVRNSRIHICPSAPQNGYTPQRVGRGRRRGQKKGLILKLGFKASAEQFAPRQLLEYAVLAEEVGLDSVWISDHFQPWRHTGGHAPFSLSWLGALGARTQRIIMGTSVLTPTFRYHPSIVAQAFGTLGSLFPDRVVLGAGTGESLNEVPSSGLKWPEQKERTARFREAIRLIKTLWSSERVSFEGDFYKTELATIYDRPAKPVPIFIAGAGPFMAKLAGLEADGFICTSGKKWELYTDTLLPNLKAGLEASGRSASINYDKMIELKVSFDTDRQRALEDTKYWGALALTADEKMNVEDPLQLERLADSLPVERAASRWIVTDDADEMIERVGAYIKLGFNHLVFHAPGKDQARFLKLFAQHLAPRLRQQYG